jgi:hypothetical protein
MIYDVKHIFSLIFNMNDMYNLLQILHVISSNNFKLNQWLEITFKALQTA